MYSATLISLFLTIVSANIKEDQKILDRLKIDHNQELRLDSSGFVVGNWISDSFDDWVTESACHATWIADKAEEAYSDALETQTHLSSIKNQLNEIHKELHGQDLTQGRALLNRFAITQDKGLCLISEKLEYICETDNVEKKEQKQRKAQLKHIHDKISQISNLQQNHFRRQKNRWQ